MLTISVHTVMSSKDTRQRFEVAACDPAAAKARLASITGIPDADLVVVGVDLRRTR
jgi:hypothetical protein